MTLSCNFDDHLVTTPDPIDSSTSNWEALYCSHLWKNSDLRKKVLNSSVLDRTAIEYCYTCRGKIRNYELRSPKSFQPVNHSTPSRNYDIEIPNDMRENSLDEIDRGKFSSAVNGDNTKDVSTNVDNNSCIPTISRQIDSSFRQKYSSYEMRSNNYNQRRLRKSLKGFGCIVNFALTESPVKKRTQIQACSISVMIIAIVVISFVLVNFTTPHFTRTNVISTIVVPTPNIRMNESSSAIISVESNYTKETTEYFVTEDITTSTSVSFTITTEASSLLSSVISKIRKNIKTYPKDSRRSENSQKRKDIINRDILSQNFCSCQRNEVCMLDENSGTAICKVAVDEDDPTGCGGLCALETEACQLVDKARGVRVCRLLTLVTCSPDEWRCRNGLCVPGRQRCDGTIHCYDRSDEMHCECDLTKAFRCGHSISCFPSTKMCNGVIDCWDGFDELNCTAECPQEQFTCTDGQCILSSMFCDGLADCADGSDEPRGCGVCGRHEVRCKNHRCVHRDKLCDGRNDCGDNTDENGCS